MSERALKKAKLHPRFKLPMPDPKYHELINKAHACRPLKTKGKEATTNG